MTELTPVEKRFLILREFAREIIGGLAWTGADNGDVIQEVAARMGIIIQSPGGYDPKRHTPDVTFSPGDPYYEYPEWMKGDPHEN